MDTADIWINRFRRAWMDLNDSKARTRKEAQEELSNLLESNSLITVLDKAPDEWTAAFTSVKTVLYKELSKVETEISKKGKESPRSILPLIDYRTLLQTIVENANKEKSVIKFRDFYHYVQDCYSKPVFKKHCLESCLEVFKQRFLLKDSYWSEIDLDTMLAMKDLFKSIHLEKITKYVALDCYTTVLKKGSEYKLPVSVIKQEADFVRSAAMLIHNINDASRWLQTSVAKLLLTFCQCCGARYKQLCITEGENILFYLMGVRIERSNHAFKIALMEIMVFLLERHEGLEASPRWRLVLFRIAKFIKNNVDSTDSSMIHHAADETILDEKFLKIVLGCYKQCFDLQMTEERRNDEDEEVLEPSSKRAKRNAGFLEICKNFEHHIECSWMLLFSKILEKYPSTISESYFERLLTTYTSYVKDCKSPLLRGYVFKCLSGLIAVEEHLILQNEEYVAKSDWLLVYDSAIRAIGLNQSANESHMLLQQLLIKKHDILSMEDSSKLWNLCTSRSIQLNVNGLQTFHTFGSYRGLRDNTSQSKDLMIDFFLQTSEPTEQRSYTHFSLLITAEILTNLTFKHYTNAAAVQSTKPVAIVLNNESYNHLLYGLHALVQEIAQKSFANFAEQQMLMECTHLVVGMMYHYKKYDMSLEGIKKIAMPLIQTTWEKMIEFFGAIAHVELKTATYILNILHDIVEIDDSLNIVKGTIDMNFIEAMVEAQCNLDSEPKKIELKFLLVKIFTLFSLRADSEAQESVQVMLYEFDEFDPLSDVDYKQAMIILGGLASENCGLSGDSVRAILTLLQRICSKRHNEYRVCVDVLHVLKNIFWHLIRLDDLTGETKNDYLGIFKTLHHIRRNYGYEVELALVDCIDCLLQAKKSLTWAKHNDELLVLLLPYYLVSDYLEVQQQALKTIALVFAHPSNNSQIDRLKSEFLIKILEKLDAKLLASEDEVAENQHDIVLKLFSNIIVSAKGTKFSKLALSELIVRGKKYDVPNVKIHETIEWLTVKQIDITAQLNMTLKSWCQHYSILDFPYSFFNYPSKKAFYTANISAVTLNVVKTNDEATLQMICHEMGRTVAEVLEKCYPNLVAINLVERTKEDKKTLTSTSINSSFIGTATQVKLDEIFSCDRSKQLMSNNIDAILIEIARYVHDPVHFEQFFNYNICITEAEGLFITHATYCGEIMTLLSEELKCDVVKHLADKLPCKMQQVLQTLQYNIWEKTNADDKLIEYYHYAIIVQYIMEQSVHERFIPFILRYVIYTNINLIKHEDPAVQTLALKYMSKFIEMIIPKFTKQFAAFIIVTCSAMVPHAIKGDPCALNVLRTIILSNHECINENLQYLDPLPENNAYVQELRHRHMKFRSKDNTLENEIKLFLVGKQFKDSRTEGLKYLRVKLKQDGAGLKRIYANLQDMGGILSKESILHSLITTLVELVRSKDAEESMEAVKCLGILGASDLTTMVLKTEDVVQTKDCSSYLFITKVIELLNDYQVDRNAEVAKHASKALYAIFATEEGRNVLKHESTVVALRSYLFPFYSKGTGKDPSLLNVTAQFCNETLRHDELWCPTSGTHEEWIKALVTKILEGFPNHIMKSLIPIVAKKVMFAEECFPHLINLLLDTTVDVKKAVGRCIKMFFEMHWSCQQSNNADCQSVAMNMASIRCILNTIHFVRLQRLCDKRGKYQELDLDLDYLHVAKAAQYCSAHFSALMYAEKWYHATMSKTNFKEVFHSLSPIGVLDEIGEETTQLRSVLTQAYKGIGDNYALFGGHLEEFLNVNDANTVYTKNKSNPDFQLLHRDIELGASSSAANLMTRTLKDQALYYLALSTATDRADYGDAYYECRWRLSQWDLPNDVSHSNSSFEFNMFNLLNAFNDYDKTVFDMWMDKTRLQVAQSLKTTSLESCKTLYGSLSELERLQELEYIFNTSKENGDLRLLMDEFKIRDEIQSDYQYWEPRIAQRIEAINILQKREYHGAENTYVEMSLQFADATRQFGNLQVSKRILSSFGNLDDPEVNAKVALLEARIYWKLGHSSSISKLKKLLNTYEPATKLRATILKLCGEWMMQNQSEFPKKIYAEYFHPCINILNDLDGAYHNESEMLHEAYKTVAKFADEEYQHINRSLKSPEFERKVAYMTQMKETAEKLNVLRVQSHDIKRARVTYERMIKIDEIDIKNKHAERESFLKVAVKYYLYHIKLSTQGQTEIFRIFSLWLENKDNENVTSEIEQNFLDLETYKILTMLPQLVPHISIEEDRFSRCINLIIENCAKQHPHHAIPLILSVANTNQDDNYTKENAKTSSNESRIRGAQKMIKKLRNIHQLRETVEQNEKLALAYMELAYYACKTRRGETVKFARTQKIYSIRDFTQALLPTYNLPYRPNLDYSNIVSVYKFKPEYSTVGGINEPKRLECIGSDGVTRYQLVKGKDDLRQDAVMQQVFVIMNGLLRATKETLNFTIRTYKVVPLSKRSGVLEWVSNTMPVGEYLAEAHKHYYPKDKKFDSAKQDIKHAVGSNDSKRLAVYLDICEKIHPIFHKFFETNFLEPTGWYEKRRAYTQSIATSSMCGYVLGIGDRHVQNILIDKTTAEVVHIDFGVAFEQGRILPTPETVPFRLTRDIVDGMGICGVEGTFRKTCEKTMEALQRNATTIQTILEVLLYDPLYDWSITPTQAYSKQMDEDSREDELFSTEETLQLNASAERALGRLKHKLLGIESGNSTNVETQVDRLIKQAREPSNLCKLFYGWQAFL